MQHATVNTIRHESIELISSSAAAESIAQHVKNSELGTQTASIVRSLRCDFTAVGKLDVLTTARAESLKHVGAASLAEKVLNLCGRQSARQTSLMARITELEKARTAAIVKNEYVAPRIAELAGSLYENIFQPNSALIAALNVLHVQQKMVSDRETEWFTSDPSRYERSSPQFIHAPGVLVVLEPVMEPRKYDYRPMEHAYNRRTGQEYHHISASLPTLLQLKEAAIVSAGDEIIVPVAQNCNELLETAREISEHDRFDERAKELTFKFEGLSKVAVQEIRTTEKKLRRIVATAIIPEAEARQLLPSLFE